MILYYCYASTSVRTVLQALCFWVDCPHMHVSTWKFVNMISCKLLPKEAFHRIYKFSPLGDKGEQVRF